MRHSFGIWALAFGVWASACGDDDDTGGVDAGDAAVVDAGLDARARDAASDGALPSDMQVVGVRFKATLGSRELVCGQSYAGLGTSHASATPQDFRFFVQQVRLINGKGEEVPMQFDERAPFQTADVALIDFTDSAGACANSGDPTTNMVITGRVPKDTYSGIVIVNGVPESLNHGNPATAPAPLRATGASWSWLSGYRFVMAELLPEAAHDLDAGAHGADAGGHEAADAGAGGHGGGGAVFVHSGSTSCTGTPGEGNIQCSKPNRAEIRLAGFNPAAQQVIVADLAAVFAGVDLSAGTQCHGSGASCATMYSALGVELETGAPKTTQSVFRVE